MRTQKHLYDIGKQSNLDIDWNRSMKNLVHNKLKEAHNKYFSRLFDDNFSSNHGNFGNILEQSINHEFLL